jgi:hypothetical protein
LLNAVPEWVEVRTQEELDAALARPNAIPVCLGEGRFAVSAPAVVRAGDAVHVSASGEATVEAWGKATVEATGDATVGAWDSVGVTAAESARIEAWDHARVKATDSVSVRLWGWAEADASGSARVEADHWTVVHARDHTFVEGWHAATVTVSGDAVVRAWDEATVDARDDARVDAWGEATVDARGSATVRAWGTAIVRAFGSATVTAFGSTIVSVRGAATVTASDHVVIRRHGNASKVTGGVVTQVPAITTAEEWCAHWGVAVEDGVATLYKAVDGEFVSRYGMSYAPGSEPQAPDWDGGEADCGGGLHFSPSPSIALQFEPRAERYVACPVRLDDISVASRKHFEAKVKAPGVCAPVYEVDEWGARVERS